MATPSQSPQSPNPTTYSKKGNDFTNDEGRYQAGAVELEFRSIERALLRMTGSRRDGSKRERKPSERTAIRSRQNSLRRAKNSTDMLRERSINRQRAKNDVALDGNSDGRERKARQFTVANVGGNGRLYLRSVPLLLLASYLSYSFTVRSA